MSVDAGETAFAAIKPLISNYERLDPEWNTKDKTDLLLTKTQELSWAASVTSRFLGDYLGKAWQPPKRNPFAPPGQDNLWSLSSLIEGSWPVHRYCPANIILRSPSQESRTIIYLALNNPELRKPPVPLVGEDASAAHLRLNTVVRILGETLLSVAAL